MNKRPIGIIHKFKQFDVGEIGVSTITVSELQYGAIKGKNQRLNKQRIEEFLSPLEILPYDEIAAEIKVSFESPSGSYGWSRPVAANESGSE